MGLIVFFYLFSLLAHELGHASATTFAGKKAKEIGFGFYMIFPVLYTDVTSVWTMKKNKRILVNLGGIYFQLIINSIAITCVYMSSNTFVTDSLKCLIISNFLVAAMSLTPFLRNDGYWALSDYWGIPNLLKKSDCFILNVLRNASFTIEEYDVVTAKKLVLYGLANTLFRLYVFIRLTRIVFVNSLELLDAKSFFNYLVSIIGIAVPTLGIVLILRYYYTIINDAGRN